MISISSSTLKTLVWITVFFAVCGVLYVVQQTRQSTYKGQTMEWWVQDFAKTDHRTGPHLTQRQEKVLEAFQHFEKEGYTYLLEEMGIFDSQGVAWWKDLIEWGGLTAFGKHVGLSKNKQLELAAGGLWRHLRYPSEWTDHRLERLNNATEQEVMRSLFLLQNVTNRQAEIIQTIAPFLAHTNRSIANLATIAIGRLYSQAEAVPEIESYLSNAPSTLHGATSPYYLKILTKHADQSSFALNRLIELSEGAQDIYTFHAVIALTQQKDTRIQAIQQIEESLNSASRELKPFEGPFIYLPQQQSSPPLPRLLAALEFTNESLDGLQTTLLGLENDLKIPMITQQISRIFAAQKWESSLIIDRLINYLQSTKRWEIKQFQAFLSILLLDSENTKAWEIFDQAVADHLSQEEFITLLNEARNTQGLYGKPEIWTEFEQIDYKPFWEIGEHILTRMHEKAPKTVSNKK